MPEIPNQTQEEDPYMLSELARAAQHEYKNVSRSQHIKNLQKQNVDGELDDEIAIFRRSITMYIPQAREEFEDRWERLLPHEKQREIANWKRDPIEVFKEESAALLRKYSK